MRVPRYRIVLQKQGSVAAEGYPRLTKSSDAVAVARAMLEGSDRERFLAIALDSTHHVIGVHEVAVGSLSMAIVHPREVFKFAMLLNAAALIVAHNHTSGDPDPSPEDRALTTRLVEAGKLMGIGLLDHVVLGEGRSVSFADQGWLT